MNAGDLPVCKVSQHASEKKPENMKNRRLTESLFSYLHRCQDSQAWLGIGDDGAIIEKMHESYLANALPKWKAVNFCYDSVNLFRV